MITPDNVFEVPLTASPDQTFTCVVPVDAANIRLRFNLRYNTVADYWWMSITDDVANTVLLDSIPLLPGRYPADNILEQHEYLQIGSAFIVPVNDEDRDVAPNDTNLGADFLLLWSGNIDDTDQSDVIRKTVPGNSGGK